MFVNEYIAYSFIFIGLLNIAIMLYFKAIIYKGLIAINNIISLNIKSNHDTVIFLQNLFSITKELMIIDYGYSVYFMKQVIDKKEIKSCKKTLTETMEHNDYEVQLHLCPKYYRGEYKIKYKLILKILKLIIMSNLLLKNEATNKSFNNISKYHTFLLHDTKNISQYLIMLQHSLDNCKTDKEKLEFFHFIEQTLQTANQNTKKLINYLSINNSEFLDNKEKSTIDITLMINDILTFHKIDFTLSENVFIEQNKDILQFAFENIIKNFKDKQKNEPDINFEVKIEKTPNYTKIYFIDDGSPILDLKKLFEPFNTSKEGGLGIGLYKTKILLNSLNIDLDIQNKNDKVSFVIIL